MVCGHACLDDRCPHLLPVTPAALHILLAGALSVDVALVVGGAPLVTVAVAAALDGEAVVVRLALVAVGTRKIFILS